MKVSPLSVALLLSTVKLVSSATSEHANSLRGQKAERWHRVLSRGPRNTPSIITGNLGHVGTTVSQANQVALENAAVAALTGLANDGTLGEDVKPGNGGGPPQYAPARGHNGRTGGTHFSPDGSAQIRMLSFVNGMEVEGCALVMNVKADGTIAGVNGEVVSTKGFAPENDPKLPPASALEEALKKANLNGGNGVLNGEWVGSHRPAMVRTPQGFICRAWSASYRYDTLDEDGSLVPHRDDIYAEVGTGYLCANFPRIYGGGRRSSRARAARQLGGQEVKATQESNEKKPRELKGQSITLRKLQSSDPSMNTQNCNESTSSCITVSTSASKISTGDAAIDGAHNYAIATYDFYMKQYGRNSIDDAGMTLISRVHYDRNYNNAFWDGSQMTYGDGDGTTFIPLSQDADVVAHELTHGVTERSSGLVYRYESGALNEALSDIFGAMVDFEAMEGGTESSTGPISNNTWLLGEDIYTPNTPGDGLRVMNDPVAAGDYDWYPGRYTGSSDNGGVHWNSGIANLAFYLMTEGGLHPRNGDRTIPAIQVPRLGSGPTSGAYVHLASPVQSMYRAARLLYLANTDCLTPSSNFEAVRYCTADMHGGAYSADVHAAWDAVGVPNGGPPPPPPAPISLQDGVAVAGQSADTGNKQDYILEFTLQPGDGTTVICTTSGNNGDADLYLRFGAVPEANPSSTVNDCASFSDTSDEQCIVDSLNQGGSPLDISLHALVHAYSGYSDLSVECATASSCQPKGSSCTDDSQCCMGKCKGSSGNKSCK